MSDCHHPVWVWLGADQGWRDEQVSIFDEVKCLIAAPLDHILHSDIKMQTEEVDHLLECATVIILSGYGWVLSKDGKMNRLASLMKSSA